jgi:precorrin-6Y C5,15-methyltransferase (decarboxylating)
VTEHLPVVIVGVGDDGVTGLGERARQAIRQAELLVGGRRHLDAFAEHPAERLQISDNVAEVLARIEAESSHRRCVVLASGDPCYFGIGPLIAARLGIEKVEIIPQASSVAQAFARLGLAWHDAVVLSAHGRPLGNVVAPALRASKLAILTDPQNTPSAIAGALLAAGLEDCRAVVCEHLGGPAERLVETRLAHLPSQSFAPLNVLVLLRGPASNGPMAVDSAGAADAPLFGRVEAEFHHARGQITKQEVRAITLAKLRLPPGGVLWDLGAGAGSLAIEAAGLMPSGLVWAVERDPEQLECLQKNLQRHAASRVRVVDGQAPEVLHDLPPPDRVFVGGGGKDLPAILERCLARLANRGRLVVNAATLDSVMVAERVLRRHGWSPELVQVAVSRGKQIAGRTRLEALNPVFIVVGEPEGDDAAEQSP